MKHIVAMAPVIGAHETPKGTLYSVHYFGMHDHKWHIGYSSDNLDLTRLWLINHLEIVPVPDEMPDGTDISMVMSGLESKFSEGGRYA